MRYLGYSTGMKVNAVVEEINGSYIAYVPVMPGCFCIGESEEEAIDNLKDMIENQLGWDLEINDSISSLSDFILDTAG